MKFRSDRQRRAVMAKLKPTNSFYSTKRGVTSPPPFKGKDDFHLPVRMSVYVPSTTDRNKKISPRERQRRIRNTQKFLSGTFGGSTKTTGEGTFVSGVDGSLIKEQVYPVTTYADKESYDKNVGKLRSWIKKKKKDWGQEGIGFEFEDDFYSI